MRSVMKNILQILIFFSISMNSIAEVDCYGKVTLVMGGHVNCGDHLAFMTDTSAGKWMCSNSKTADAVLLSAQARGKIVHPEMKDEYMVNKDCSTLAHYKKIHYEYSD
jgi:uncharacterized protein (AIM24 family)